MKYIICMLLLSVVAIVSCTAAADADEVASLYDVPGTLSLGMITNRLCRWHTKRMINLWIWAMHIGLVLPPVESLIYMKAAIHMGPLSVIKTLHVPILKLAATASSLRKLFCSRLRLGILSAIRQHAWGGCEGCWAWILSIAILCGVCWRCAVSHA